MSRRMRSAFGPALAGLFATVALAACSGPASTRAVLPALAAEDVDPASGYEPLRRLRASELVPGALREGPHHRVREAVETDGFLHHYVIESDFGEIPVAGDDLLRVRVAEVEALAQLERMQKREEFAKAMAMGLKSPFVAAWNLLRDPVDSILGVPQAAWDTVRRTAELTRRERGELEDSGFREFIGFETRKRELAYELGVDPYTSNRILQKQLNRFAWAAYLGGLPFALVPFQGEAGAGAQALAVGGGGETRVREILRQYSPEDLRRLNRIELTVMGVPTERADAFLAHPWFSPRHQTILVDSLVALDLTRDRRQFVETALQASSEADARFYQRAAQLLRLFHEKDRELSRVVGRRRAVMGTTEDGELVVPLILDEGSWSRPAAEFADRVLEDQRELGAESVRLLVSGSLTPRARSEFELRGIRVLEHAFEQIGPELAELAP